MHRILIRNSFLLSLSIINFGSDFAYSHKKFDTKVKADKIEYNSKNISADNEISTSSQNDVYKNLLRNFDNFPSFEESMSPASQFENLFRKNDRELKKSVFRLWETYEKEMSKQIGTERLNGPDINNTINDSLNSLSK